MLFSVSHSGMVAVGRGLLNGGVDPLSLITTNKVNSPPIPSIVWVMSNVSFT